MTALLARCRQSGSFIAGTLIGLSIASAGFGATEADSSPWRTVLVYGAPVILMLGLALQILMPAKSLRA